MVLRAASQAVPRNAISLDVALVGKGQEQSGSCLAVRDGIAIAGGEESHVINITFLKKKIIIRKDGHG